MAGKELSDIPFLLAGSVVALQEEVEKAADLLVEKGKSLTPEGRKKAMSEKKGLISKGDEFSVVVARTVQRVLENVGIVTRSDLEDIDRRVAVIEKKVAASKKKSSRKPAKKVVVVKKPAEKPAAKKAVVVKKPPQAEADISEAGTAG